jgi:hypothetical protein
MFQKLRVSSFLLSCLVLASAATSCSKKADDPTPTPTEYKVVARYAATNLQPNGQDAGSQEKFVFSDESETGIKSLLIDSSRGTDDDQGASYELAMAGSDKVSIELEFPFIDTAAKGLALPATTTIKAEILVNGKVKRTVVLDKTTAFDTSTGTLHLKQVFKVSEL